MFTDHFDIPLPIIIPSTLHTHRYGGSGTRCTFVTAEPTDSSVSSKFNSLKTRFLLFATVVTAFNRMTITVTLYNAEMT